MSVQRTIGTRAETAVVNYLRDNGFPYAERRALQGALDKGDITGTPGLVWEVKGGATAMGAGELLIQRWLAEAETERVNAGAARALLVVQRKGYGPARAGYWLVYEPVHTGTHPLAWRCMRLDTAVYLLRALGYGDGLE